MKVAIVRHGHDGGRNLTDEGRAQAERMGLLLRGLELRNARVFYTRLPRAVQSAEIVMRILNLSWNVMYEDHAGAAWDTRANDAEKALYEALAATPDCELAVVVTHRPDVVAAWQHFARKFSLQVDHDRIFTLSNMQGILVDDGVKSITFITHAA